MMIKYIDSVKKPRVSEIMQISNNVIWQITLLQMFHKYEKVSYI